MTKHFYCRWQIGNATRLSWALSGLLTLALCGCGSIAPGGRHHVRPHGPQGPAPMGTLPPEAFTGQPADGYGQPGCGLPVVNNPYGFPLPQTMVTPWAPPGIALPWPHDEYLHDGGDKEVQVTISADDTVNGLELEDTIVYGDTIDDRKIIEPSNRVHLYAPRFGAVRRVSGVQQNLHRDQPLGAMLPVQPGLNEENLLASTAVQPLQPIGDVGIKQPSTERLRQVAGGTGNRILLGVVDNVYKTHEDFQVIRIGIFQRAEKARLAESVDAAITWTHDQAVQVILEKQNAVVETGDQRAQATYRVDVPNNPRLQVVKVASKQMALPGEIVEFTIRFDNVGDQAIGNVTLVDNLTTRLEYVADSAKSSRTAEFFTQPNVGDSLVLRWEFAEPLGAGEGGLVRFQCKVR